MTARIKGDGMVAGRPEQFAGPFPGVAGLPAAVLEQHQWPIRVAPRITRYPDSAYATPIVHGFGCSRKFRSCAHFPPRAIARRCWIHVPHLREMPDSWAASCRIAYAEGYFIPREMSALIRFQASETTLRWSRTGLLLLCARCRASPV